MKPAGDGSSVDGRQRRTTRVVTNEAQSAIWMFLVLVGSTTETLSSAMVVVVEERERLMPNMMGVTAWVSRTSVT